MAFNIDGFVTVQNFIGAVGGTAINEHRYSTNDTKNAIETAGYFNDARDEGHIRQGDLMLVAGDRDGTPFTAAYIFASVPAVGAGNVTITEMAAVTQNVEQVLTVRVPAMGTASTQYVVCPVAGSITSVDGVANANGSTSTATVTVTVPTTGAIATLPFTSGYVAGTKVSDVTITAHSLDVGAVIALASDGGGDSAADVIVTLKVTPA